MFRRWLYDTLTALYPGHSFDVLVPPDAAMGDYSVNLAFVLAKKEGKNPRDVAQEICDALMAKGTDMIERCQVAGPGFVNVFLHDEYLRAQVGTTDIPNVGKGQRVIIDYSSPNIAKPMHIGHLRSTIIGDALANVYRALGYDVVCWNYIGDWGTQFGKLIAAYKRWPQTVATVDDMVALYVRATKELDDDAGRVEFKKLEDGDAENRTLWKRFRDLSLEEFKRTYRMLGVDFDVWKGESEYEKSLPPLIERLTGSGVARESEGALIIELPELPPGMVRKSDGATTYLARDIASLEDRVNRLKPTRILYVIANQQALHLEQLFAVARLLGLDSAELIHVKYGLVLGEDGKKFSTREGNAVPLSEVTQEVIKRAAERNPATAQAIGIAALKYNDLRQHPYSDIVFDWKAMLDLGGNSGPYLQYTYARMRGIRSKAGLWARWVARPDMKQLGHPTERALMRQLLDFGHAVSQAADMYALNGLALYLYELAEKANRYYEEVRINDDSDASRKAARLKLLDAVAATMKKGLELLGIQVLERI